MGTEPQSLYDEAEIVTFSYIHHTAMMDYFPSRLSRKEYHSLVYQAHGECEFTRQSIKNQSIVGQHVQVKHRPEDTTPHDLFDTSVQMPAIWGMGPTPYANQMLEEEVRVRGTFGMAGKLTTYPMYYGVDQDLYHIRCPRPFFSTKHPRYSPDPYRFICMGRLDPLKQYNLSAKLVDDFRKDNQHYPPFANARLSMVGDGWGKEQVYASLAPYDFIDYYPWIDMKQLVPIIQSHDMMLMHSSSEGGPLITIECLSCGLPVHSTPVGIHSALSSLDPQRLLFSSQMEPLTDFVLSTCSIDSHVERYRIIEQIRRVYSKSTLRFI
ncbi:Glycosyl transferase, family 1 [uncultured Caudovirales phage]|uniref:Glycosyl transferase, family 1 n=1 Tax=uncultured Caudovirales phage TaxID=2100421 RepID=A0A6J5M913_9CAUD|nr:Glycosyl transferase, family 1 [uncultured Caudovirales phage]